MGSLWQTLESLDLRRAQICTVKTILLGNFPATEILSGLVGKRTINLPREARRIEVFVDKIQQLFNSMDPSPFHEKDLDHEAEEFIVSRLQEFSPHDRVSLLIHVNRDPAHQPLQEIVEKAVHNYFLYRARVKRLELRRLLKQGRTSLIIGLCFLATCLLLSELLLLQKPRPLLTLLRESLTIAGWVAMWQPMQTFLYGWWPLRHLGQIYKKLSHMRVEVRTDDATT